MAKQPIVQRDRFRIICEADAEHMGALLAQMTRMGLENIGYELITDVVTFNKNGARTKHEVNGTVFASDWIKEHPTFKINQLVKHFEADGRTAAAAYGAANKLLDDGVLKKLSAGNYSAADVKAIEPPKATDYTKRYEISNQDLAIKFARRHNGRFTSTQLKELFRDEKHNPDSVSNVISTMVDRKLAKRISEGSYVLLTKASTKPKKKSAALQEEVSPAPKSNGVKAPEAEANG